MLIDILQFVGVLFCLFTAFLIRFRLNKENSFSGHLLAVLLVLIALCNSFYLFIVYGVINYFPYLYKIPAPITYLIFPLSYLYVRAVLNGEKSFKKIDALHLIPFLFFTVNYFPFYIMGLDEKSKMVFEITQDFSKTYTGQDGLLPEWVNIACRASSSVIYLLFQWRLINSFFRKRQQVFSKQFALVKKWVYDLTIIQTIHSLSLVILYIVNALIAIGFIPMFQFVHIVLGLLVCCSFLLVSCYLLWNPNLLIGLPNLYIKNPDSDIPPAIVNVEDVLTELDNHLNQTRAFLDPNLKIDTLSRATNIPTRKLTHIISESNYDNFNDYINQMRISYAVVKIEDNYLHTYSVEALSVTCGFNSKNAFYRAFKKAHDCTPVQYCSNHFGSSIDTNTL
ncbi:helix-turn-helix domain-containing protein [Zobellia sp. B3R18]|uniref:helix-turn-helix domain-containing protein n=1 Tax=Zobellia sp. B3R18 TaxID=2841568 RepID=UPI001C066F52|nr:AraC family transcriptional regulator [Zobellia sp. B3R18]MBU2974953.1 AraC family transcriptional regulator [Zobellia sp. B3R18]